MKLSHDAFAARERSLENEFFYRVDQDLIRRMRRKSEEKEGRERLAQVTGISDSFILDELLESGIRAETLIAFSLIPLVWVAFADRTADPKERDAVLRAAETVGVHRDAASFQLLSAWLERQPDERLFVVWKHYVQALEQVTNSETFEHLKQTTTQRARDIAEATGGFLGIQRISDAEQAVIDQIESAFAKGINSGTA